MTDAAAAEAGGRTRQRPTGVLTRILVIAGVLWTLIIAGLMTGALMASRQQVIDMAREQAHSAWQQDVSYRLWAAEMGGLYVRSNSVAPNPYLPADRRQIQSGIGSLTLVNPAYMTRMVHERDTGHNGHITSLKPIRPDNAPDAWEIEALTGFEDNPVPVMAVAPGRTGDTLRYMAPLITEPACLTCHGWQGYSIGEVRGGISFDVPLQPIEATVQGERAVMMVSHLAFWILGLAAISGGGMAIDRRDRALGRALASAEQARDQADQASAAKSRFLATMSHELRTPLNAVIGFADTIEQGVMGPAQPAVYAEYAGHIRDSGRHLLDLVNQLIDLGRVEAGRRALVPQWLALGDVVSEVIDSFALIVRERNLILVTDLPDGARIHADPVALRQCLVNLFGNAVKFTDPGDRITLAARILPDATLILVSDTGRGIAPADLDRVTLPFEQVRDDDPHHSNDGIGLGLAIIEQLVMRHGGKLFLCSEVRQGTVIALRFPNAMPDDLSSG